MATSKRGTSVVLWLVLLALVLVSIVPAEAVNKQPYIRRFNTLKTVVSTVPTNGDINPYGVALVMRSFGNLVRNNVLVSNFNNSGNLQGTGTTIVQITPTGQRYLFAQLNPADLAISPQAVGLTTALVALRTGWVIVGSLPTTDGTSATMTAGNIFVLNSLGEVKLILSGDPINGPWDACVFEDDSGVTHLFVSCVLNGTVAASPNIVNQGTIIRIDLNTPMDTGTNAPTEISRTVIVNGLSEKTDPAALVVGPTGLAVGPGNRLYIADTVNNRILSVGAATTRTTVGVPAVIFSGAPLNGPLGLIMTPTQDILVTNGGDGNMVELGRSGRPQTVKVINLNGAGTLFGLANFLPGNKGVYFVDDGVNTLRLLTR